MPTPYPRVGYCYVSILHRKTGNYANNPNPKTVSFVSRGVFHQVVLELGGCSGLVGALYLL
jgi:hypothetical protein